MEQANDFMNLCQLLFRLLPLVWIDGSSQKFIDFANIHFQQNVDEPYKRLEVGEKTGPRAARARN